MANDPLSFLDQPSADQLSFLDEKPDILSFLDEKPTEQQPIQSTTLEPDPLSFLDEKPIEQQPIQSTTLEPEPSFLQKTKDYFTSGKLGEALVMQQKSGGYAGAPVLHPKEAAKVGTEVATIGAVEAAFAPLLGAAAASIYAPRILTSLTRLTRAGTTGLTVATTGKLVEKGELPTKEELVKDGLTWVAIDAILQGLHVTASGGKMAYDFGKAVNNIAKKEGVPATKVLGKLWDSTKNYIRSKYGRIIQTPQDITPQDVQLLEKVAAQAEKEGIGSVIETEIEPIAEKPIAPKVPSTPPTIEIEPIAEKPVVPKVPSTPSTQVVEKPVVPKVSSTPSTQETQKEQAASGYIRKPEPKTVDEKISHLSQKITESKAHVENIICMEQSGDSWPHLVYAKSFFIPYLPHPNRILEGFAKHLDYVASLLRLSMANDRISRLCFFWRRSLSFAIFCLSS